MSNTRNVLPVPTSSTSTLSTRLHFVIEKESVNGKYTVDPNVFLIIKDFCVIML